MTSPRKATGHQPAPEQHTGPERIVPTASQSRAQAVPFEISPLALQQMADALLTQQEITDCLELEGQAAEKRGRHGS